MKRFLYLLFALPLLMGFTACSDDDDDVVRVNLQMDYSNATSEDGVIYVIAGDAFNINSLKAVPEEGTAAAALTEVEYFWDGAPLAYTALPPFSISINTQGLSLGAHTLSVYGTVVQEGKPISKIAADWKVVLVENTDQQPGE